MIILITMREHSEKSGREEVIVSHGVDHSSGRNVVLPCETLEIFKSQYGARFDKDLGEYVLDDIAPSGNKLVNDF